MRLNLNGVEIDLPNNAKVDVSKDGKSVKIELPETEEKVVERIKVIEGPERIIEKYLPCTLPHYPCNLPHYPQHNPWRSPYITWSGNTQVIGGLSGDCNGGLTVGDPSGTSSITCCNNPNVTYTSGYIQQVQTD